MSDYHNIQAYIDFDNNADFTAAGDDVSAYATAISIERVVDEDITPGYLQLTLSNDDGRFTPQNTAGAYYPDLKMGRRVKITAALVTEPNWEDLSSVDWDRLYATYDEFECDLFNGFITTITPEMIAEQPGSECVIEAYDLARLLEKRKFSTGTLIDQTADDVITLILNQLGVASPGYWSVGYGALGTDTVLGGAGAMWRELDAGKATFAYVSFDGESSAAAGDVVGAEVGQFYMRRDGWAVFEHRHHHNEDRASNFTFTDAHISEMVTEYTDDELWNHVEVIAHPRQVGTAGTVVWSAIAEGQTGSRLETGGTRDYSVHYTDPETSRACEVLDVVALDGSDYLANEEADGSGKNLTTNLTVTAVADDNERYAITAVNSGLRDVYITKLQMRATPLVEFNPVTMTAEDETSIVEYLQRDHTVDLSLWDDSIEAQSYAEYLLGVHKDPKTRVKKLTLNTVSQAVAQQQVLRELSDRVTVNSSDYAVNDEFFITGITMESEGDLENIVMEMALQEAGQNYWLLGTDALGTETVMGYDAID